MHSHAHTHVPGLHYRADIDGLRAIAVGAVVLFHVFPALFPGGFVGVDIFFVISGFLISGIIFRGLAGGRFSYSNFYARRIKRIFPALVIVLVSAWGLGWLVLLPDEYQLLGKDMLAAAGFVSNLSLNDDVAWYFGIGSNPLVHLWSLGIEEQFYLLWPLFLVIAWNFTERRLRLILGITVISFTANIATSLSDPMGDFYLPWNRLWELSSGAALAYFKLFARPLRVPMPWEMASRLFLDHRLHAVLGVALLLASFWFLNSRIAFPSCWALAPCMGTLLLISVGPDAWVNRTVLSCTPLVFVGLISYPLYLWHWPLLTYARILSGSQLSVAISAVVVALALVLAFVTFKYIEIQVRSPRPVMRPALVTLCGSMVICAGIGMLTFLQIVPARSQSYGIERLVGAATEDWLINPDKMAGPHWARWAH